MAEVTFIPYGNASEKQNGDLWEFTCQHGERECVWNQVETCGYHYITDKVQAFNFTDCIENNNEARTGHIDYEGIITKCAAGAFVTDSIKNSILGCYNSAEGNSLEHQMALATPRNHEYVPWIIAPVAGGVHDDAIQNSIQSSLLDYVCANYTGNDKSSACPSAGYMSIPSPPIGGVCKNEDFPPFDEFLQ